MPTLVGASEIHERFGLTRTQIFRLVNAGEFPEPAAELARGRVWDLDLISECVEGLRAEGRITKGGVLVPRRFLEVEA